ncbi:MAG TPA: pitrilysin family protein [Steroidobacteraceae bacterium]|nr:pitrilysin family protein [Steroidobacteraceae bacterium]
MKQGFTGFGIVAVALIAATGAVAGTGAVGTGAAAASPATVRPDVTRATLANGLRVVIVRDTLAPVVTTEVNYLVGSDEAPSGFPGTAHAVEHMMFRGSPGLSKDQLAAVAANMGGSFDADTTESVTQYYFLAPAQDLDVALHVESLRMRGLDVAPAEWAQERGAIEQEVSHDLSNPAYKFYERLQARLFAGTPYAHTPLGTRPSFDKTTARLLKAFHDRWYAPNNAILVIAGDVDPGAVLARAKAYFGGIPAKPLPPRPAFEFRPVGAEMIRLPTDSPYGTVYLAWRTPGLRSANYATALVMSAALDSKRAPLYGMGMDGTALFGGFYDQALPRAGTGMAIGVFARGSDPAPVLAKMRAILAGAAARGIDPALVAAAKRKAIASLEFDKNSVDGLANAWSQALAFQGLASPNEIKAAIEAVTPRQVDALARRTFNPAHEIAAVLTPRSSGKPVAGKGFGGAERFASNPGKPVRLPGWAARSFARLAVPRSTLAPSSFTLANGLKLIVQPESTSDTVQVFGRIKSNEDLQAPIGEEGIADVLDGLFPYGTTTLDRLAYQRALDRISASASAGSSFALAVPAAHFAAGMRLLADDELHPALPPKAFAIVREQQAGFVAGEVRSPDFLLQLDLGKALLPPSDPELRYAKPANVAKLTLAEVEQYYARTFRPDMATIVIVGKVRPAEAERVVASAFGGWRSGGPRPDVDYGAVPPNSPGHLYVPDSSATQDSVRMSETITVTRDDPARFALNLGDQILGGGFYASRLYRDLREKSGLVYTVGTRFDYGKNRSTYTVSFGADSDKVASARAIVERDLTQMQKVPVPAADLERAKGILLRQIPLGESSFDAIGGELLQLSIEGKPLDAMTLAARHYLALTAAQVRRAYARYVRPDGFVTAVKGPAPR